MKWFLIFGIVIGVVIILYEAFTGKTIAQKNDRTDGEWW